MISSQLMCSAGLVELTPHTSFWCTKCNVQVQLKSIITTLVSVTPQL